MVPNGWEAVEVDDLAKFSSGGTPSKQNEEYWNGSEPWISGKDLKTHYLCSSIDKLTEKGFAAAKKAPKGSTLVLVRGMTLLKDFPVGYATRELSFNQDIKALVPLKNVDGLYLSFLLSGDKHKIMNLVSTAGHGTGRLDTNLLKQHPVNLPPFSEQQKIAKILSTWDKAISTTERLIDNSTQQKKALMQQLLTGKKRLLDDAGERFEGEWVKTELRKLLKEEGARNKGDKIQRVLSVTNHSGFVLPEEQFSKRVASKDTSNYKIVRKGQFGYNPSRINVGSFARLDEYEEGVLSPMYVIFSVLPNKLNSDYFHQWMHSHEAKQRINNSTQGSVRDSVNFSSLEAISLGIPNLEEQQKIAAVLTNADKEIELLEQQLADLQQEKKALMQVLLTGKKRVVVDVNV
ncbi:restriction endonuclease subunit S [Psychrobacter sp. SZ93C1]|uniref:restriction endonuclease subunit S n=1 Tax=Psychrobacter sp. SZ93C1 TaxID=2792058 RepID=UPI0018CDDBA6|nr:restriction endonuclease subunit S [Psychrobacter sp. SZ93C1]MBH0065701.1 restriction endonuclease subunit S [Psychrobacter sp. SZ93C1]